MNLAALSIYNHDKTKEKKKRTATNTDRRRADNRSDRLLQEKTMGNH